MEWMQGRGLDMKFVGDFRAIRELDEMLRFGRKFVVVYVVVGGDRE